MFIQQERRQLTEVHEQAQVIGSGDSESNRKHQGKTQSILPGGPKVGRNDPCPCGAKKADGTPKKYKHCHGQNA